jgi:hypothetical protein
MAIEVPAFCSKRDDEPAETHGYCWSLIALAFMALVAFAQRAVAQSGIQSPHMKTLALVIFIFFFAFAFCLQCIASPHVARNERIPTRTRPKDSESCGKTSKRLGWKRNKRFSNGTAAQAARIPV